MATKKEDDEGRKESSAGNAMQNILGRIGEYVYGTVAKSYRRTAQESLLEIKEVITEYESLYGKLAKKKDKEGEKNG